MDNPVRFRCPHCPYVTKPQRGCTTEMTHECRKHPRATARNPRPRTTLIKETADSMNHPRRNSE